MSKEPRFKVIEGSESAHCCFDATVVDTHKTHSAFRDQFEWVCECFEMADAEKICSALNDAEEAKPNIEAAAKTLASAMDYPWEHMPEQGREEMRKHAKAVIEAAMVKP